MVSAALLLILIPFTSFAATSSLFSGVSSSVGQNVGTNLSGASTGGFNGFVGVIKNGINIVLPLIISLAVLFFLWGIFLYVRSNDPGKQEEARMYIIWSLVFIAVMVSVWGLVNILTSSFSLDKTAPAPPPIPEYSS